MFTNEVFDRWLDEEMKKVLEHMNNEEPMTQDDKLAILIKGLSNHITHLDEEIKNSVNESNQRIDLLREEMNQRLEKVDQRFEKIDQRFEKVDQRFDRLTNEMVELRKETGRRFENVDRRFENVDKRFESMLIEINKVYQCTNSQTWKMIGSVGLIVLLGKLIEAFGS